MWHQYKLRTWKQCISFQNATCNQNFVFLHTAASKKWDISYESSSDKHLGNKMITTGTGTLRITTEMLRGILWYLQSHSIAPFPIKSIKSNVELQVCLLHKDPNKSYQWKHNSAVCLQCAHHLETEVIKSVPIPSPTWVSVCLANDSRIPQFSCFIAQNYIRLTSYSPYSI